MGHTVNRIYAAMAVSWRVFKLHHPVGAYHPVGQLDADCHACGTEWPCAEVRKVMDAWLDTPGYLRDLHHHVGIMRGDRPYREVADEIGITVSALHKIENGSVDIRLSTIVKILNWLEDDDPEGEDE